MAAEEITNGEVGSTIRAKLNRLLSYHRYYKAVAKPNIIHGYSGNDIATDVEAATISGGGAENYENVIGGTIAGVGTENSNLPVVAGTGADYAMIHGGYDNVNNSLASNITGQHCSIAQAASHGTISGGSKHKIVAGSYGSIVGGTQNIINSGDNVSIGGGMLNEITANNNAVIGGGYDNEITAGTTSTISGGRENTASGNYSSIIGGLRNVVSAAYGIAMGWFASATYYASRVWASGRFTTVGDAQVMDVLLRAITTDATLTSLGLGGQYDSNLTVAENVTWHFKGNVIARRTDTEGDTASFSIDGMLKRDTAGSTAFVGVPTVTALFSEAGAATWAVTVALSTNDLRVRVTGEADKTIRWLCKLEIMQIIGA